MSLNESSATALIRFTGLGIVCFNKDKGRGEIAAIRDNKHVLTIRIQKPAYQEGLGNDKIEYQDIASYDQLPNEGVQLEIKATGPTALKGYEVYKPGNFDRLNAPDMKDFRWIVNMNDLHGPTALSPATSAPHHLAKFYIDNGLFYTHKLDRNLFFEKVEKDNRGNDKKREVFGNVGETIGAKLDGDEVTIKVRIGDREETHTLRRVEGLPFKIEIRNMDSSGSAVYSDMADYYGYLATNDGARFDFSPVLDDEVRREGGSINQIEYCHPIGSDDLDTIDDLPKP